MSDFTQPMILTTSARLPFTSVPQTYELYRQKSEKRKAEAEIAQMRLNIRGRQKQVLGTGIRLLVA